MLGGMLFRSYAPTPPLADFVQDFWLYDDYRPRHLRERILPSGAIELVINLRDNELRIYDRARPDVCERFSGAVVSGTYDRFFVIDTAEEASLLGVHFRPGGAFPFFGLPVSELVDTHVDLETLWGRSGRELRERLRNAARPLDKFRVLEALLVARLPGARCKATWCGLRSTRSADPAPRPYMKLLSGSASVTADSSRCSRARLVLHRSCFTGSNGFSGSWHT
jgi:hypothetical protein